MKFSEIKCFRGFLVAGTGEISNIEFLRFCIKGKSKGDDFYATARKRVSVTFAAHIENAVKSGQLLYRDAYKLTSMKGDTFDNFFTQLV